MAFNSKALLYLIFGTFCALLGTGIICGGGFNSVQFTPTEGPYRLSTTTQNTLGQVSTFTTTPAVVIPTATATPIVGALPTPDATAGQAGFGANPFTGPNVEQVNFNNGHYASLLKQYPELFNWAKISDVQKTIEAATQATGVAITEQVNRDAAQAYTRYHAGEQAWIFAFLIPLVLVLVALAFIAYGRKSGYTLSLVGLGLSAFLIAYTLVIVVHYQNISFVPEALNAFSDCNAVDNTTREILREGAAFGTLTGPVPRRAWLCRQDWTYDNDFRVAANLVWGGASVAFVGFFSLLIGFAYLVQPFVTPAPAFAKAGLRSSAVIDDSDDYSSSDY